MYLIPPAFSCCVNCEHESRRLIKPYCPRLLSVLNFTPSINKAIIFLCTLSKPSPHMFGSAVTIVYEGCFKDLLCISSSLLVNPLPMSTMGAFIKKRALFFSFSQSSNCEGIVFWMHLWNCLSQGVLIHTFVELNLQIVVAGHMGIMQCKLLKRTQTGKFSRLSVWEGLSESLLPVLTLEDTSCWMDLCFLFSNLHCLSCSWVLSWSWPKQREIT